MVKLYSTYCARCVIKNAQITGSYSQREAFDLANVLNNPLAVELTVDEMYEVGPSMAAGARDSSLNAVKWGAIFVVSFMIIYYFIGGFVAVTSAIVNIIIVLGVLASLGATLTLPGVAALVLTLGMGVDANILIFERLREELKLGKSLQTAAANAFQKVTSTIVDANVTTLHYCLHSYLVRHRSGERIWLHPCNWYLRIDFCALVVTRLMVDFIVHRAGLKQVLGLSLFGELKIDFLKHRKPAFLASWSLVVAGVVSIFMHHDNIMGIDFTGGDEMTVAFEQKLEAGELGAVAAQLGLGEVNPVYQKLIGEDREVLKLQTRFDQSREVLAGLQQVFPGAGLDEIAVTQIGATVSSNIQWNAILSVLAALGGILLYVALRFEVGYGVGAVVATIHDVFMTIGVFVICGALDILLVVNLLHLCWLQS